MAYVEETNDSITFVFLCFLLPEHFDNSTARLCSGWIPEKSC